MDIILKPDALSLSGSMNRFIISSSVDVSFALSFADTDTIILQHTYTPNKAGRIEIDLESIVIPLLSFTLRDTSEPYTQPSIFRKFKAVVSAKGESESCSWTFGVLRAGIDRFSDSATNFLQANFLTWQPTVKPLTYHTPEFLSYYAVQDAVAKCKAYFLDSETTSDTSITLGTLAAGMVHTIPVQYAIIAGKVGKLPSYYDVWVETLDGIRLTYVQRYHASNLRSDREQWVLFENSLGGIDTFRAYGESENTAKHTHNIVEIENESEEYRVDTEREFKKSTGFLGDYERRWLLDFFPSLGKYIYIGNGVRRIVVTDSGVTYKSSDLPSAYTFTYKYADARPYLNLPRTPLDTHFSKLDIKIPDVGSFTIAPRLVEFQKLPLSGGALFPVQSPYSQEWATTTGDALLEYITGQIVNAYKGDGGFGHSHPNISLLNGLTHVGQYLLLNAKKISAGLADLATEASKLSLNSPDWDKLLRKDKPDEAREIIKFLKGIITDAIHDANFEHGVRGFGMWLDENGRSHVQVDFLETLVKAVYRELEVRHMIGISGDQMQSASTSILLDAIPIVVGGVTTGWKCHIKTDDGTTQTFNTWVPGDQIFCQTTNIRKGLTENAANKTYWRVVIAVVQKTDKEEAYIIISNESPYFHKDMADAPAAGDETVQFGFNAAWAIAHGIDPLTYANRMNVSMNTISDDSGPVEILYRAISGFDYSIEKNAIKYFSANRILLRSNNLQWISESGATIPNVIHMGKWPAQGTTAHKYESWQCDGGTWLCIAESTKDRPGKNSPAWSALAEKGSSPYTVIINTDRGNIIHNGQGDVVLTATVLHGEEDITDTLQPNQFSWLVNTPNAEFNMAWNKRHEAVGNRITVSAQEIDKRAQIDCIVNIE